MSVVTLSIKSDGQAIPVDIPVVAVDVRHALNRLSTCTLLLVDGDIAEQKFAISDGGLFKLGAEIEVLARYEDSTSGEKSLFKGLVVRHGIESNDNGSCLRVEMRDKALRMTRPRRSQVFVDAKDSDVFAKLAKAAGLQARVDATTTVHPSLVQVDCTDWDWLVTRAEAIGMVVATTGGGIRVTKPVLTGSPVLQATWGMDIMDMEFECDALGQDASVEALSWDIGSQKLSKTKGAAPPKPKQGRMDGADAAEALGFGASTLVHRAPLLAEEAKAWADATAARTQFGLLRGRLRVQGTGLVQLLDGVEIVGVAKAFQGEVLVTGVCHRIGDGDWTTDLQFGLDATPHHRRSDIVSAPAAGLLPPATGLQIGIVEAVAEDPLKEHRVKVKVPSLGESTVGLWARIAAPDAGNARGICFRPEPGDEVVLGFFNDDPRLPVVLGALFSSKNAPPAAVLDASDKNNLRGFVTRSGLTLALDDEKKQLSLQTPSGAKLLLDDDGEAIVLSDKHGNKITLDKDGITIASAKDFKVDASGNVVVKGSKIDLN
jgi:Rhs element Vgr protein